MSNISTLGFNGEYLDDTLDNYHLGNGYRAYNPTTMQFTAPDDMSPFGDGGINPYMYVSGDPINNIDTTGHFSLSNIIKYINDVSPIQLPTALTASAIAVAVATTAVFVLLDMATDGLGQALKPEFNAIKDISEEATKMSPLRRFLSGKPYKLSGGREDAAEAGRAFANQTHDFNEVPPPDPFPNDTPGPSHRIRRGPNRSRIQALINHAYNNAVDNPMGGFRLWNDNKTEYWVPTVADSETIAGGTTASLSERLKPNHGWPHKEKLSKWIDKTEGAGAWETIWKQQYLDLQAWGNVNRVSNLFVYSRPYTGILNVPF